MFQRLPVCVCLSVALLGAGCVGVNSHVLPGALIPGSDANSCYRRCEDTVEEPFRSRCIDQCPGATSVRSRVCGEIAVRDRDVCYQSREVSATAVAVILGTLLLGVLSFGFLALSGGVLAH